MTLALVGVSGQLYALATLTWEKNPLYPLERRLGGSRASLDAMNKKILPCWELNLGRAPHRPSQAKVIGLAVKFWTHIWEVLSQKLSDNVFKMQLKKEVYIIYERSRMVEWILATDS